MDANDWLLILGALLIVAGIALYSIPAGLIAAGLCMALAAIARDVLHDRKTTHR